MLFLLLTLNKLMPAGLRIRSDVYQLSTPLSIAITCTSRQQGDLLVKTSALSFFVGRREARSSQQDGEIRSPNIFICE